MPEKIITNKTYDFSSDQNLWELSEWEALEKKTIDGILSADSEEDSYKICKNLGKKIIKNYSNSFFTVTRFLPKSKRDLVEIIYGSVRFPDEIVDTFDLPSVEKHKMLENWKNKFLESNNHKDLKSLINNQIPVIISSYRKAANEKKYLMSTIFLLSKL